MKKYTSLFGLIVRSTWKRIAIILILMLVIQGQYVVRLSDLMQTEGILAVDPIPMAFVGAVAFFFISAHLAAFGSQNKGGFVRATIERLQVSKNTVFAIWSIYGAMVVLIFWAVQAGILIASDAFVNYQTGGIFGNFDITLMLSQSSYYYMFLPFNNPLAVLTNFAFCIFCGAMFATASQHLRVGKKSAAAFLSVFFAAYILSTNNSFNTTDFFYISTIVFYFILTFCIIYFNREKGGQYD